MIEGLNVLLGLVAGFVLNEIHHWRRRREWLDDRDHADEVEQDRWHRDAKRDVYVALATAIHELHRRSVALSVARVRGPHYSPDEAKTASDDFIATMNELHVAVAGSTVVVPAPTLGEVETFAAKVSGALLSTLFVEAETAHTQLVPYFEELSRDADELLAQLRGDLLGHTPEQLAAEYDRLAHIRAQKQEIIDRASGEALAKARGRSDDAHP